MKLLSTLLVLTVLVRDIKDVRLVTNSLLVK